MKAAKIISASKKFSLVLSFAKRKMTGKFKTSEIVFKK